MKWLAEEFFDNRKRVRITQSDLARGHGSEVGEC